MSKIAFTLLLLLGSAAIAAVRTEPVPAPQSAKPIDFQIPDGDALLIRNQELALKSAEQTLQGAITACPSCLEAQFRVLEQRERLTTQVNEISKKNGCLNVPNQSLICQKQPASTPAAVVANPAVALPKTK